MRKILRFIVSLNIAILITSFCLSDQASSDYAGVRADSSLQIQPISKTVNGSPDKTKLIESRMFQLFYKHDIGLVIAAYKLNGVVPKVKIKDYIITIDIPSAKENAVTWVVPCAIQNTNTDEFWEYDVTVSVIDSELNVTAKDVTAETTIGNTMAHILADVAFQGVEQDKRYVVGYSGSPINSLMEELSKSGLVRPASFAGNEFVDMDVAYGVACVLGHSVAAVSHQVGLAPAIAEIGKFQNEGLGLLLISAYNPVDTGDMTSIHSAQPPWAQTPETRRAIDAAKGAGMEVVELDLKRLSSEPGWSPIDEFRRAVEKVVYEKKQVLVMINPELPLVKIKRRIKPIKPAPINITKEDEVVYTKMAEEAVDKLMNSSKPFFYVGEGMSRSTGQLVEQISEELRIPVAVTWGAKGYIREDFENYIGLYQGEGTVLTAWTRDYIEKEADFAIRIGNRIIETDVEGLGSRKFPANTMMIKPEGKYPNGCHIDFFLHKLLDIAREKGFRKKEIEIQSFKKQMTRDISSMLGDKISRRDVFYILSDFFQNSDHSRNPFLVDQPSTQWYVCINTVTKGYDAVHRNALYGELGVAGGQALGVALMTGRMPVILTGDGAMDQKDDQLIRWFVKNKIDAVFLVFDNQTLGMGKLPGKTEQLEREFYGTSEVDLVETAKASGAKARKAEKNGELLDALKSAERDGGVNVIVVPVDPNDKPPGLGEYVKFLASERAKHTVHLQESIEGLEKKLPHYIRDMTRADELARNLIEMLMLHTSLDKEEIILAFDKGFNMKGREVLAIAQALKNIKEKLDKDSPFYETLSRAQIIIEEPENFSTKLKDKINNDKILIFTFAPESDIEKISKVAGQNVFHTYIDDDGFPDSSYYPLPEAVVIALADFHGLSVSDPKLLEDSNIRLMEKSGHTLTFRLKKHDPQELKDRNDLLVKYITQFV